MYVLIACQVFEGADVNRDIVNCQVKDIITSIFSFEKYIVQYKTYHCNHYISNIHVFLAKREIILCLSCKMGDNFMSSSECI